MTVEDIFKIIDKISEKNLGEFKIETQDIKLEIKAKKTYAATEHATANATAAIPALQASPAPAEQHEVKGNVVKSPVVGTFYASSAPDKEPFVKVGQQVKKGDVLYIIESMKLMNEIASEFDGVVTQIIAQNAQPVEFGQPIMIIE
ncbi:MAG TPA: acetyl-CoA carboxylase biotin carboxyl carrier protein [Ruminococcaceae bacterium]|nr:acetyl-CoA carboxylase biotin carboxyl carrier protein [Oscillospiraceae bacterium]